MAPRAVALLVLLAACASRPPVEDLVARARTVPLTDNQECLRAWREVRDRATEPRHRVEALYGIGCAHKRLGQEADMGAALEEAVKIETDDPRRTLALYLLAEHRYGRGDVRGAVAALEEFQERPTVNRHWAAAAGELTGRWLVELGETERAKASLRAFLARNPHVDRWNRTAVRMARELLERLEAAPAEPVAGNR